MVRYISVINLAIIINIYSCSNEIELFNGRSASIDSSDRSNDSNSPENDDFKQGNESTPITGQYLSFDNARARCEFEEKSIDEFDIVCRVVSLEPGGQEVLAKEISEDLDLDWKIPQPLKGEIKSLDCSVAIDRLKQNCRVKLSSDKAEIKFFFEISSKEKSRMESSNVVLPYFVGVAAGFVSAIPYQFKNTQLPTASTSLKLSEIGEAKDINFGFQAQPLDPTSIKVSPYQACISDNVLYFSSVGSIYSFDLKTEALELFAGSYNQTNRDNFTHRLRTSMSPSLFLACGKDALFVSDSGNNRVLKIRKLGPVDLVTANYIRYPRGIAVDREGNLYVASGDNKIISISSDGKMTDVAGTGELGPSINCDDGPALQVTLNNPVSIALDLKGNLYFTDISNYCIRKLSLNSKFVSKVEGTHLIDGPGNLTLDSSEKLYVSNSTEVDSIGENGELTRISGILKLGNSGDGGPASLGVLDDPKGLVFDKANNLYIMTKRGIRKISTANVISTVVGQSEFVLDLEKTDAKRARLGVVKGLALDNLGNLYLSDTNNSLIKKVDPLEEISVFAGNGYASFVINNSPASQTSLLSPQDIVRDPSGNLFFISANMIHKLSPIGLISHVAGSLSVQPFINEGPAFSFELGSPLGLGLTPSGDILIADTFKHRVLKLSGGNITTLAGFQGVLGFSGMDSADNVIVAAGAKLHTPTDVAEDSKGNIFIVDNGNFRLARINNGKLYNVAGLGDIYPQNEVVDAKQVALISPFSVAVGYQDKVYLSTGGGLFVLTPVSTSDYSIERIFGGLSQNDCGTGRIKDKTDVKAFNDSLKTSLANICVGSPVAVATTNNCGEENGKERIVFSQLFGLEGNVVEIVRPCH